MLDRVGRYRVEALIGEGAMADVYRAFDPGIHRTLAVKILKPEFRQNREYASRFLREAKAAGALNHPSIVTIYDVGQVDGYPYIAMELIDGRGLNDVVRERGSLPPEEVTAIGLQLAEGLRYAHGLGVVHRDIKPSNIMLLDDGRTLKILDFGIARMAEGDTPFDDGEGLKTQIGQVLGSPRYMSPEQALGRDLDGRSDLFSVGVVLYELVTGKKAFSGVSPASLALQITQQDPPSLADAASDAPRGLQFIINKLLAKRPERRFRDGAQLAEALRREQAAYIAVRAEAETRRRYLPLQLRTTLLVVSITAVAMVASITTVLNRQDAAMQHVALTSGSAVAAFVANNAALRAVDNATLPPEQRDWLPTQAFVQAAASDPNIRQLTIVDADGIVRASQAAGRVGRPYQPSERERLIERAGPDTVTVTRDGKGFRFVRVIEYAGRPFGVVDMVLDRAELRSAADLSTPAHAPARGGDAGERGRGQLRRGAFAGGADPAIEGGPHRRRQGRSRLPYLAPSQGRIRRAVRRLQPDEQQPGGAAGRRGRLRSGRGRRRLRHLDGVPARPPSACSTRLARRGRFGSGPGAAASSEPRRRQSGLGARPQRLALRFATAPSRKAEPRRDRRRRPHRDQPAGRRRLSQEQVTRSVSYLCVAPCMRRARARSALIGPLSGSRLEASRNSDTARLISPLFISTRA